jgi:tungstate transport system substrate-binding protein
MKGLGPLTLAGLLLASLVLEPLAAQSGLPANPRLRLATTTSTRDSGLLDAILPAFTAESGYRVEVTAVGTGAAIKLGRDGNADILLVHDRPAEELFLADGFGIDRRDVMYNDFVLLGPKADPAGAGSAKGAVEAFAAIFKAGAPFISRGDKSGTDSKEKALWKAGGFQPTGLPWYREVGQGMSPVILMADQLQAYTLADYGTWLAMRDKSKLVVLSRGDKLLFNPYGLIIVNPARWPATNLAGATALADWLMGPRGQALITAYTFFGEQCFYAYK